MCGSANKSRTGITLIELLLFVAVIGILAALLMVAVVRVREAAARTQSANNLKQIILAVHNFAGAYQQRLPTIEGDDPNSGLSLHAAILPYIEQGSYFDQLKGNPTTLIVSTYVSPADPTIVNGKGGGWNVSSYAANAQVFTYGSRLAASIPDGVSNTIAFAEHYGYCNKTAFAYTVGMTGPGNIPHRATFAEDAWDINPSSGAPSTSSYTFQVAPILSDCNPQIAQTPHRGGMLIAVMDGSVKQISPSIDPLTFWGAVTPAGGENLTDWN